MYIPAEQLAMIRFAMRLFGFRIFTTSHPSIVPIKNMIPMLKGINHLSCRLSNYKHVRLAWKLCNKIQTGAIARFHYQEMRSCRVTVVTKLANISAGENTQNTICSRAKRICIRNCQDFYLYQHAHCICTLFMSLRALAESTLQQPEARNAPTRPTIRNCSIGMVATSNRAQNPILLQSGLFS